MQCFYLDHKSYHIMSCDYQLNWDVGGYNYQAVRLIAENCKECILWYLCMYLAHVKRDDVQNQAGKNWRGMQKKGQEHTFSIDLLHKSWLWTKTHLNNGSIIFGPSVKIKIPSKTKQNMTLPHHLWCTVSNLYYCHLTYVVLLEKDTFILDFLHLRFACSPWCPLLPKRFVTHTYIP